MSGGLEKAVLPLVVLGLLVLAVFAPPVYAQMPPAGKTYRVGWLSPASEETACRTSTRFGKDWGSSDIARDET